ncbi:hypothetical protein AM493_01175 [Flavobacterium akiainvivens]|uniref:Lipoprotein n=1 Tax=Flavobacterium akiainvivens TaxID=1202724 RepID=A0A0M8MFZ4_9FLAO|nr:hypothetical protein [Flavobacterium akiainvivens]KOS04808.1 hypothetical protein AM493_01175 [Flavobacterium akiainvivens]SFQ43880.1 hypothetical protein SAMN05444144_104292 [Flavobacterium akiainvivens]
MKIKLLLLFITSILFVGCGPEAPDIFNSMVKKFATSEGYISLNELSELKTYIEQNPDEPDFSPFLTNEKVDDNKLAAFLKKQKYKLETPYNPKNDTVKIYIENSLSMLGYISNKGSNFKTSIQELLFTADEFKGYSTNYISDSIYPTYPEKLSTDDIININRVSFSKNGASNSKLEAIFKQVLSEADKNTVSILVSDCIYSLQKGGSSELLNSLKTTTRQAFKNGGAKYKNFSILILKLDSEFSGSYFDRRDHEYKNVNTPRPFYVVVMGEDAAVSNFKSTTNIKYTNSYTINTNQYAPYHTIVNTNTGSGFKPDREYSDKNSIRGIQDIVVNERVSKTFTFSVAVDMSSVPVDENIIKDPKSYSITAGNYKITGITAYNDKQVKPASVNLIKKSSTPPTHIVHFAATKPVYTNVTFGLKREIPNWVTNTHTVNDTIPAQFSNNTTFGFKYLVEGINEAINKNTSNNYFTITITIN